MDAKVSKKEQRWQPDGTSAMVLVDNIFDFYPIFENALDQHRITDIEVITDPKDELLDQALFAVVKQKGADPLELEDGVSWAEALIGDVPSALVVKQITDAVNALGPGVRVVPGYAPKGITFKVELTNPDTGLIV